MNTNYTKKRDAMVIGEDYGFFPDDGMRFEMERPDRDNSWGFFANKSNRNQVHIKFKQKELDYDT